MNDIIIKTDTALADASDLAQQRALTRALTEDADSPNTRRAYQYGWKVFKQWADGRGVPSLPATPVTVAAFLWSQMEEGRAAATIRLRAAAIAREHRVSGFPDPCRDEVVRADLRAIAKRLGTGQAHAAPLRQRDEDVIVARARQDRSLRGLRDLALLLVGRDILARANELVAITVEMIRFQDSGEALVDVLRRKTDTEARPCILGAATVAALVDWLGAAGITTGYVFLGLGRSGTRTTPHPLCRQDVSRILKRLARQSGVESDFSSHSLRIGMAQDLLTVGHDIGAIAHSGGWKTTTMPLRYVRDLIATDSAVGQYRRKIGGR